MEAIILLGAPGSGKGTAAERLREETAYLHVSTGDMLRAAVKEGGELGQQADSYMKKGELVPDEIIIRLVEERMDAGDKDDQYMFDGFPRTVAQAELLEAALEKRGGNMRKVFFLDSPREVLVSRLAGRRICRKCGRNYHVVNIPPAQEGVCDLCGGELYQRPDDCEDTVLNRLDVYNRQTESLIARYEEQGALVRVDSDSSVDELVNGIKKFL